jgi:hypothetical protein
VIIEADIFRSHFMKSFKIVAVIIGLSLSALVLFQNAKLNKDAMVEDTVGTSAAAPQVEHPEVDRPL